MSNFFISHGTMGPWEVMEEIILYIVYIKPYISYIIAKGQKEIFGSAFK